MKPGKKLVDWEAWKILKQKMDELSKNDNGQWWWEIADKLKPKPKEEKA